MLKRMLPLLVLLILCAGCGTPPAAATPDSKATEAAMVANVQATLTAGVPPTPTTDTKATEAALVANVQKTLTAAVPPSSTPDAKATESAMVANVQATLTADAPATSEGEGVKGTTKSHTATSAPPTPAPPTSTSVPTVAPPATDTPMPATSTPLPATSTPLPQPTETTAPKQVVASRALLAYTVTESFRDHYRIDVMYTDGTGRRLLSDMASEPSFSPDGKQVVFYSWPGGLEAMNLDGSNRRRLIDDGEAAFPAWSPDGQYIAFHSSRGWSFKWDVYIIKADGSEERMLVDGEQATWSPNSQQIVYKGCLGNDCGLMIINVDGSGKRRLTTCPQCASDGNANWSPDNNRIVFTSERDGNHEIYVMNPDGSGQTRLTNMAGPDAMPAWLPGGQQIAFRSARDGAWGIWIMNADGSNVHKLTDARVDPDRWIWEKMAATRP